MKRRATLAGPKWLACGSRRKARAMSWATPIAVHPAARGAQCH